MAAAAPSCPPSQPRVPDSRLPGAEPDAMCAEEKQAELQQPLRVGDAAGGQGYDFVLLFPMLLFLTFFATFLTIAACYGPTKMMQVALLYLVPQNPNMWHVAGIWLATVAVITFGIPVLLLVLAAVPAMMFGFVKGFILTATAEIAAACLCFVIGRYVVQRPVRLFLESRGYYRVLRMLRVLEDEKEESMKLLILYRFMMMPIVCRNYGPALLLVPIWKLIVSSVPHSVWSAIVFATVGSALQGPAELVRDGHKIAWKTPQWQQIAAVVIEIASFVLFTGIAYRAYQRKVEAEDERRLAAAQTSLLPKQGHGSMDYGANAAGVGSKDV